MSDWDTQKKALLPYLQRAAEIEAHDPKVAYYCRLYAVEQGIRLEQRDQRADDLLELVLNQLEQDKPHLVLDTSDDSEHCERFALTVYNKARRRDEQGIADRDTAKAYYAAFNFIEILKQFGALSSEVEKERRFAVFRAAEIKRCLDEGTEPPPLTRRESDDEHQQENSARIDHLPSRPQEPPSQRQEAPPLIDYDPGYVIGSKIVFMDGQAVDSTKGVIRSKAQEGGFFNIEAEDGSDRKLGALFLAPDLSEGGDVIYYSREGQLVCKVVSMRSHSWPPIYELELPDGSHKSVNHSHFVLTGDPVVDTPLSEPEAAPVDTTSEDSKPRSPISRQGSWLRKHQPVRTESNGNSASTSTVPVEQPPPRLPTPVEGSVPGVDEGDDAFQERMDSTMSINTEPGYVPDAAAIEHATKCSRNATAALNFNDVEEAIIYLQLALKSLKQSSN